MLMNGWELVGVIYYNLINQLVNEKGGKVAYGLLSS
jgi:hypothetical protein